MTTFLIFTFIVIAVIYVSRSKAQDDVWPPKAIRNAVSELSEYELKYEDDVRILQSRADKLYQLENGEWAVADFKSRKSSKVYPSDVQEISVSAYILRKNGYKVAKKGYVFFPDNTFGSGELMSDAEVEALIKYREDILTKKVIPIKAKDTRQSFKCNTCGYKEMCGA